MNESKDLKSLIASLQEGSEFCDFMITKLLHMDGSTDADLKKDYRKLFKEGGADAFKDDMKNGKKLKYTEEELEMIEEKINEIFPEGHEPLTTTMIPFGFYLGQLLRKKIPGAEWKVTDEVNKKNSIWDVFIEFKNSDGYTMQAKPFMRVDKFWRRREDKMSAFVKMIEMTSEIKMDPEYWNKRADDEGWIETANEMSFRVFQGSKKDKIDGDFSKAKGMFHNGKFGDGKY